MDYLKNSFQSRILNLFPFIQFRKLKLHMWKNIFSFVFEMTIKATQGGSINYAWNIIPILIFVCMKEKSVSLMVMIGSIIK